MAADRRAAWDAYVGATRNVVDAANAPARTSCSSRPTGCSTARRGPAAEDAPPNPVNQYGFLKAASELVVHRARRARHGRADRRRAGRAPRAPGAAARAGPRLRLPRRVARRGAARRRAVHGLGEPGDQHARDADARDRRGRADLARARARGDRRAALRAAASTPTASTLARRAAAAFELDPSWCAPARRPEPPAGAGPLRHAARRDARPPRALGVELPDLDTQLARLRRELEDVACATT